MVALGQFDLFPEEVERLPWGGQSPRALTRINSGLFLRREPQKDDRFFVDSDQIEIWPSTINAPWIYQGAPLLKEV